MSRLLASARRRRPALDWFTTPPGLAALAVLVFIAISFWWLSVDQRVPDYDSGRHLSIAFDYRDSIEDGDVFAPFQEWSSYPPLVHGIGAATTFITGLEVTGPVMALNLVFLVLLAIGCYGAGTVAFDRRVGALAVLFVLATPMVISQFHVFMLDAPSSAMVAMCVWLALASRRFERLDYTLAFGIAAGFGMLTKSTFIVFLIGIVLVMLARGGWDNWRNLLIAAGAGAIIAVPWHLEHLDQLSGLTEGAGGQNPVWYDGVYYPERWSVDDFAWYAWNIVNNQLYLPLVIFVVIGVVAAVVNFVRNPRDDDYTPELLAGMVVGYVIITWIGLNDPRYTLPCLVYFAVLGTAWIVRSSPTVRFAGGTALVAILVLNTVTVSFGLGDPVRISLFDPSNSPIAQRRLTVVGSGYIEGAPNRDSKVLDAMRAGRKQGYEIFVYRGKSSHDFNRAGMSVFTRMAGGTDFNRLEDTVENRRLLDGKPYLVFLRSPVYPTSPPPCGGKLSEGTGAFVLRGRFKVPASGFLFLPIDSQEPYLAYELYCPLDGKVQPAGSALPPPGIRLR